MADAQTAAASMTMELLAADRAYFSEYSGSMVVIRDDIARDGLASLSGVYDIAAAPLFRSAFEAGHAFIIQDVARDAHLDPYVRDTCLRFAIHALISTPPIRTGRLGISFNVTSGTPRQWTEPEIALVREVASRVRDAVERVYAGQALRASERKFHTLTNLAPIAIWECDPFGQRVVLNAHWLTYTGQAANAGHHYKWLDAIHPDDRVQTRQRFEDALRTGEPLELERRIRAHDGSYRWFLVRHVPIHDDDGNVIRWIGAATDVHEQRTAFERSELLVRERTSERDALGVRLLEVEEAERRHLARELHDGAGQHLTALFLQLGALENEVRDDAALIGRTGNLHDIADKLARDLHRIAVRLRPRALDDFGIHAALSAIAAEYSRNGKLDIDIDVTPHDERLPDQIETAIFRVISESLTNVVRHSGATRARVGVKRAERNIVATVEDNGHGFDTAAVAERAQSRLGLTSMRERVKLLGGEFNIESSSTGTRVFLSVPVD